MVLKGFLQTFLGWGVVVVFIVYLNMLLAQEPRSASAARDGS